MKNPDIKLIPEDEQKLFKRYFQEGKSIDADKIMALKDLAREKKTTVGKALRTVLPNEDWSAFDLPGGATNTLIEIFDELGTGAYNKVKKYLQSL